MTIQMLSQLNPTIYEIIKNNLNSLKDKLSDIYYDLPLKQQEDCENLIEEYTLNILNDIDKLWTTQKTTD